MFPFGGFHKADAPRRATDGSEPPMTELKKGLKSVPHERRRPAADDS
jgi:hypothetical protein